MNYSPSKQNNRAFNAEVDQILDNLLLLVPIMHKKLLRMDLGGIAGDLTRLHFGIMGIISRRDRTVSELAKMLVVSMPQMTHLVDKLVDSGLVERRPDDTDRRIIHLALAGKGRILLDDLKLKTMENLRSSLTVLTPAELNSMSEALKTLKNIGAKL